MAIALQNANKVWQKVLSATAGSDASTRDELKALKKYLAGLKGNIDLQFIPINGLVNSSDSGNTAAQVLADAACKLYALVLVKRGTTAAWFKGSNHASAATTDGTQVITEHDANAIAGNEIVRIYKDGKSLSTGLTVTEDTTATGSTLTLAANRFDGFVIIGAP